SIGSLGKCPPEAVAPSVVTQPQSQTVVAGANVTFSVLVSGSAPLTYQWRLGGVNLAGANQSSLTLSHVQFSQAGDYSVEVANSVGSVTSASAVLTVNEPPPSPPGILSLSASQTVDE